MSLLLGKEIVSLKKLIFQMAAKVEEAVRKAVDSVAERDIAKAKEVIAKDDEIDRMEIDIEEECLKILALHQPVAVDLRYVIACLKMNNDLERIGDLAVNIAGRGISAAEFGEDSLILDFEPMMDKTRKMLKHALDALINMDSSLAAKVIRDDDEIDAFNRQMHSEVNALIKANPSKCEYYIHLLCVARHLERIGDYATNISEDVVYLVTGEIIRHKGEFSSTASEAANPMEFGINKIVSDK
ncbi:MAG: phosphate transport system regulatory protein PhoU [Lentisphaerae bacterium GWF2_52_8]|nr:MAG: phosphate transport system regulatory protein PhoU [Lentisphaerae bacterium GWF2_52_8]